MTTYTVCITRTYEPLKERGCRYRDEVYHPQTGLRIFREYSFKRCLFECGFARAYKGAGCIPWDFPHPEHMHVRSNVC